jgi:hypothetical protein
MKRRRRTPKNSTPKEDLAGLALNYGDGFGRRYFSTRGRQVLLRTIKELAGEGKKRARNK